THLGVAARQTPLAVHWAAALRIRLRAARSGAALQIPRPVRWAEVLQTPRAVRWVAALRIHLPVARWVAARRTPRVLRLAARWAAALQNHLRAAVLPADAAVLRPGLADAAACRPSRSWSCRRRVAAARRGQPSAS